MSNFDATDARLALELTANPGATQLDLSRRLGLARNTVHARLSRWEERELLGRFDRRVLPRTLGYPITAFIATRVDQHQLEAVSSALASIPEVIEAHGLAGTNDLSVRVAARDAGDLYRIAGLVLASPGVERTSIGLSMLELVPYRVTPLLERERDRQP